MARSCSSGNLAPRDEEWQINFDAPWGYRTTQRSVVHPPNRATTVPRTGCTKQKRRQRTYEG